MTFREELIEKFWVAGKRRDDARIATLPPTYGVTEICDIAYLPGGHQHHLLDIYMPEGTKAPLPVIVDIHGGGFTYGDKELNKPYNLYLASQGFVVFNMSYRLAPEVRFPDQVRDISAALRWIAANGADYPCDMDNVFVTGDSAGGMFAMLLPLADQSPALREIYGIEPSGLNIRAVGLVSGAFNLHKGPLQLALTEVVFGPGYKTQPVYQCLDMRSIPDLKKLPPAYMVTSKDDFVRRHSIEFAQILTERGVEHKLHDWPAVEGKKLEHVFSVLYPTMQESVITTGEMIEFFLRRRVIGKSNEKAVVA